ncbi:MAG: hypothetical protein ACJ8AD_04435 [Gemmatimonadaceae bacterium]
MIVSRLAARAVLVAALALAAGCRGTTDVLPPPLEGSYVLHTAAGQPAPALIHTAVDPSHPPIDVYVLGDTLEILDGGRYIQRGRLEARTGSQLVSTSRWSDHGVFTVDGNALHFDSEYLQNITFDGTIANGMLSITQNLASEGTADVYLFTHVP